MYDADRKFQSYLRGELHADGWKSQWRLDLERRMAAAASMPERRPARQFKPRPGYYANLSQEQRQAWRTRANERRRRLVAEGMCRDCGGKRERAKVQNCDGCLKKRYERQKRDRVAA